MLPISYYLTAHLRWPSNWIEFPQQDKFPLCSSSASESSRLLLIARAYYPVQISGMRGERWFNSSGLPLLYSSSPNMCTLHQDIALAFLHSTYIKLNRLVVVVWFWASAVFRETDATNLSGDLYLIITNCMSSPWARTRSLIMPIFGKSKRERQWRCLFAKHSPQAQHPLILLVLCLAAWFRLSGQRWKKLNNCSP